jgi:hypothetical protein
LYEKLNLEVKNTKDFRLEPKLYVKGNFSKECEISLKYAPIFTTPTQQLN